MMNASSVWKRLSGEADAWDVVTYETAKQLTQAMREAGVSRTDSDVIRCIQGMILYQRTHFDVAWHGEEFVNCIGHARPAA